MATVNDLARPVTAIAGVGPARAQLLHRLGMTTVGQLLHTPPREYIDLRQSALVRDLQVDCPVTVYGVIRNSQWRRTRQDGSLWIGTAIFEDDAGGCLSLVWFAKTRGRRRPHPLMPPDEKRRLAVSGVPRRAADGTWQMQAPDIEQVGSDSLHTGRLVPVYALTAGISQKVMRRIVKAAVDGYAADAPDVLPASARGTVGLPDKAEALGQLHFPDSWESLHAARQRLAFEELLLLRLTVAAQRRSRGRETGRPLPLSSTEARRFIGRLPFSLTNAQARVLNEVDADLAQSAPMQRLLQGDVGSGKTVIAAFALVRAVADGRQSALLAPSDILAQQHAATLTRWLEPDGISVHLLRGATRAADRRTLLDRLAAGEPAVVVGTHALLGDDVRFHDLAVVVVDEQHRFGVEQRRKLLGGRRAPHLLVVSATPIPRTLAHCLYGDLDVSVLDDLPPGRQRVDTRWVRPPRRDEVYKFVRRQVEAGRQAFVVFPAIGATDGDADEQLLAAADTLADGPLAGIAVELVHGRKSAAEQFDALQRFQRGDVSVLLATSVIEVGIDVPGATVIVIEGADRFGLAQLHQLRGRVGRGGGRSHCFLIAEPPTDKARQRLHMMRSTDDGFALAQHDLALRGPGEILGVRQSGVPDLSLLAQTADLGTLNAVQTWAERLLDEQQSAGAGDTSLLWQTVAERLEHPAAADRATGV